MGRVMACMAVRILAVNGTGMRLSMTFHACKYGFVSPPVTVCAVKLMVLCGIGLKLRNLILVTGAAKCRINAGAVFQQCGSMGNMTLETVLVLHVRAVWSMTLSTLQVLTVNLVAGVAVKFRVCTGLTFHVLQRAFMTGGTCRLHILNL